MGPPGIPGGGSFNAGDGDFKKGRFGPGLIIVLILAVGGLAAFLIFGIHKDAERLTVPEAVAKAKEIFVKPKNEQIPEWRKWAATEASAELKREALKQLAWAKDPEGVTLAAKALSDLNEGVAADAAMCLASYGSPLGDSAKDALLAALKTAGPGAKPQIAWALVELGDTRLLTK